MKVQFKDLEVNKTFKVNDVTYTKIEAVKISCCKSINAKKVDNESETIFIPPSVEVDVDDQL